VLLGTSVSKTWLLVLLFGTVWAGDLSAETPTDSDLTAQLQSANEAMAAGEYPKAIVILKHAIKSHKECALCWLGMGYADLKTGAAGEAEKFGNTALKLAFSDSERAGAHNLLGEAYLFKGEQEQKWFARAEAEFRYATKLSPEVAKFHLNLARALLKGLKDEEAAHELRECLNLRPSLETGNFARKLLNDPRLGRETLAPDFQFTTLQGDQVSLQQFSGRLIVLDFWATWCPPCRESVSELKELTQKYPNNFVLISISADADDAKWREFVENHHMSWHQYRDSNHQVLTSYNVRAFPTYFVIDGDGIIKRRMVGMNPRERIVHRLKDYLADVTQSAVK